MGSGQDSTSGFRENPIRCNLPLNKDFREIHEKHPECREAIDGALKLIRARRDDVDPKSGRLAGAYSASFCSCSFGLAHNGRILYTVCSPEIFIFAIHPDHAEAYRRARARYRP